MFGRKCPSLKDYSSALSLDIEEPDIAQRFNNFFNVTCPAISDKLRDYQHDTERYFNSHNKIVEPDDFPPGTFVLIKDTEKIRKLDQKYTGPYIVHRKTQGNSYILARNSGLLIPRSFPVSLLKKLPLNAFPESFNSESPPPTSEPRGENVVNE